MTPTLVEVGLVREQVLNSASRCQKNGFCIFIDVGLQIEDGRGRVPSCGCLGHFGGFLVQEAPKRVLFELLPGEQQRSDHFKILTLKASEEVRVVLIGLMRRPMLPHLMVVNGDLDLLFDMKCQMFQGVEEASVLGDFARADPCQ